MGIDLRAFLANEEGASLVEYSILVGLVSAGVIGLIWIIRANSQVAWLGVLARLTCIEEGIPEESCPI